MSLKSTLFYNLMHLPLVGRSIQEWYLCQRYPIEWAIVHGRHSTTNDHPSILHFSVNKSATQYVKSLLSRIGQENGLTPVHLHDYSFNSSLPFFDKLDVEEMKKYAYLFKPHGYVYSVFGGAIEGLPGLEAYHIVLMVRDPRDVLTSMYYSLAYSHSVPEVTSNKRENFLRRRAHTREISIDEFVLENAESERAIYQRYTDLLVRQYPHLYLTRYEDMINDFETWLNGLLAYCRLELSPALRSAIYAEAEKIRPTRENIYAHVRRGKSGDYLEKLKPQTIARLNEIFSQVLADYHYI